MGDEQRVPSDQLLREARERFDEGTDFTVAVEEEFALLDPVSLDLVNRFEDVQAAAAGTPAETHLAGELIASEVEIKTGRVETFADVPATIADRRAELVGLVAPLGLELGATGSHPWANWKDQRIIDTPHYRRNDELLRYVVWKNNTFGLHVHIGIRGADRAIQVTSALRNWLPELLALSASSPFAESVNTGLHSARTQIFTRFFPRCGVPDAFDTWDEYERYVRFLYDTGSITEHTQLWWSVRPHLAFPTVEIRICDVQPVPRRIPIARSTLRRADRQDRPGARRGRAHRASAAPPDRGEHVAGDPVRPLRRPDRSRAARGASRPRTDRAADRVGASRSPPKSALRSGFGVPEQNAAERQIARFEEGDDLARDLRRPRPSPSPRGLDARSNGAVRQAAREFVLHNRARRSRFGANFVTCLRRVDGLLQ